MCLILFAVNPNDRYRLVVAANRDEFYDRPTEKAGYWADYTDILAGRDIDMGGTWLGINRNGRFAAVTNFKEEPPGLLPPLSRGELPLNFLKANIDPDTYTRSVSKNADGYRGFNLITADAESAFYYCNRTGKRLSLHEGCYGLSNQVLDCNWPKVIEGRENLQGLLEKNSNELPGALFHMLMDDGDGREFSNSFIRGDQYGTRAATVVIWKNNGDMLFEERCFGPGGEAGGFSQYAVSCSAGS